MGAWISKEVRWLRAPLVFVQRFGPQINANFVRKSFVCVQALSTQHNHIFVSMFAFSRCKEIKVAFFEAQHGRCGVPVGLDVVCVCDWCQWCGLWFVLMYFVTELVSWFGHCSLTHFSKQITVFPLIPFGSHSFCRTRARLFNSLLKADRFIFALNNQSWRENKELILCFPIKSVSYHWVFVYLFFFLFQTKGKSQTGTVSDIEKYLSMVQIQDWRNAEFQKYKVSSEHNQ